MSRSHRETVVGNIKNSMRENYSDHGVEEYYKKVGATYRNPHFPGVRNCLFLWFNQWWSKEQGRIGSSGFTMFDLACGPGEATATLMEWWKAGRALYSSQSADDVPPSPSRGRVNPFIAPPLGPTLTRPAIFAADPYTAEAFQARTGLYNCSSLSFNDIAEGSYPPLPLSSVPSTESSDIDLGSIQSFCSTEAIEMTICSFALHLIESPSELFTLLWELSTKCRWLIILAPHKKPEIKDGWGWIKWDVTAWTEVPITESKGEILHARVHCRVYRSLNAE